jgi:hypothetical protein
MDPVIKVVYDDKEVQVIHKTGSKPFRLATWAPYNTKVDGSHFWYRPFCTSEDIEAYGFLAKSANMFPVASMEKAAAALNIQHDKPLISMGSCTGAAPALSNSRRLGAAAVIAAVPMYSFDPALIPGDTRWHQMFVRSFHAGRKIEEHDLSGNIILMHDPYDGQSLYHINLIKDACPNTTFRTLPVYNMGSQVFETVRRKDVAYGLFEAALTGGDLRPTYMKARAVKKNTVSYCRFGTENLLKHNKPRIALRFLETVAQRARGKFTPPQRAASAMLAAAACAAAGNGGNAIFYIEKALELNGEKPHLLLQLAESYEKINQPDKAVEAYQRLVNLAPTTIRATKARLAIKRITTGEGEANFEAVDLNDQLAEEDAWA